MKNPAGVVLTAVALGLSTVSAGAEHTVLREDGPTQASAERIVKMGAKIGGVIAELGEPDAIYGRGKELIYRWGYGMNSDAKMVRNELLVTTDASGIILQVSYNKNAFEDPFAAVVAMMIL